jgi:hypothetical protein
VDDYKLACDTPITWDAECLLNDDEVDALLAKIEALPPSSNNPAERRQYEGEVLRVEQSGFGVRLYLTDVRRKHQPRCDDNKAAIEITMPIAAATRVVVTVDAR